MKIIKVLTLLLFIIGIGLSCNENRALLPDGFDSVQQPTRSIEPPEYTIKEIAKDDICTLYGLYRGGYIRAYWSVCRHPNFHSSISTATESN